jgi:acyl-CoA-binding protein
MKQATVNISILASRLSKIIDDARLTVHGQHSRKKHHMDIQQLFEQAVASSKLLPSKPGNETLLRLYALYKQATQGDNTEEAPASPFDFVAKAKHEAWSGTKGMSKEEAMRQYVDLVNRLKG